MKILNTITATQYCPKMRASWENTYHLIRPYKLTSTGAERILNSESYWHDKGFDGKPEERISVCRVESAIFN